MPRFRVRIEMTGRDETGQSASERELIWNEGLATFGWCCGIALASSLEGLRDQFSHRDFVELVDALNESLEETLNPNPKGDQE